MKLNKRRMITRARKKYGRIYPCGEKKNIEECFDAFENHLLLWFNTDDGQTHLILEKEDALICVNEETVRDERIEEG